MGDDLQAARAFVDLCMAHMDALISGDLSNEDARHLLREIDDHAKPLHARAICRVARQARNDFHFKDGSPKTHGNLLALNKLILQYEAGLVEVENEIQVPAVKSEKPLEEQLEVAFNKAAKTLQSALGYARPGKERAVLTQLIRFNVADRAIPGERVSLETIMPALTDRILREARQQGKSVSLSLAGEGAQLSPAMLDLLEPALSKVGCDLVCQTIDAPEIRRQKGQSRSAHIAMTAQSDEQGLHILICVDGLAPSRDILKSKETMILTRLGMQSGLSQADGKVQVALADIPVAGSIGRIRTPVKSADPKELRA